jgi:hypothetical protein
MKTAPFAVVAAVAVAVPVGVYTRAASADAPGAPHPSASASATTPPPAHIDASERVDGIRLAASATPKGATMRRFTIVADDTEAAAVAAGRPVDVSARQSDVCFAFGAHASVRPTLTLVEGIASNRPPVPPPPPMASSARPGQRFRPPPPPPTPVRAPPVRAVRAVHVAVAGDKATLENVDAWVDLDSGGVRLERRSTSEFSLVAHGPTGFDVYSEPHHEDGTRFLVLTPAVDAGNGKTHTTVVQLEGGGAENNACGHVVVTLKAGENGGQMANVFSVVQLPPDPNDDGSGGDDGTPQQTDDTGAASSAPRPRMRPVRANLSVSRVPSDAHPIVTVSFAWAGADHAILGAQDEQRRRMMIE